MQYCMCIARVYVTLHLRFTLIFTAFRHYSAPASSELILNGNKQETLFVYCMCVYCVETNYTIMFSSSTDSEVKSWHTQQGTCLRTYRGHTNDKNFVGLTVTSEFIACGKHHYLHSVLT